MNKVILIIALFFIALGCNKVKRIEKKLDGDWDVIAYTYQNSNGLSYKYPASGMFSFENCESEYCDYRLELDYTLNSSITQKISSGTYTMLPDAEYFELKRLNSDGTLSMISGRILHLNKTQLETEFKDESGIHYLVLEKKD